MTIPFRERRAGWLAAASLRISAVSDAYLQRRIEDAEAERGIKFRVVPYPRKKTKSSAPPSGASRPGQAPGVPPLPLRAPPAFSERDPRDWVDLELRRVVVPPPRPVLRLLTWREACRTVVVPGGALITGGDRAWRCERAGTP